MKKLTKNPNLQSGEVYYNKCVVVDDNGVLWWINAKEGIVTRVVVIGDEDNG